MTINEAGLPAWTNIPYLPTITTTSITSITNSSAITGGSISSDGGSSIISRGVCWNTLGNPTINDSKTTDGSGVGSFSSNINGLASGTTYYVKSYATNSTGTSYGNQLVFTTIPIIGDNFQGGKVAYILQNGDPGYIDGEVHGIIAATSDIGGTEIGRASCRERV